MKIFENCISLLPVCATDPYSSTPSA